MDKDMEERLKIAEEYIHQQYVTTCKNAGWNVSAKAKAYKELPSDMHDAVTDILVDQEIVDFLIEMFENIYRNRRYSLKNYDEMPDYLKKSRPRWMYKIIEDAVAGTMEDYFSLFTVEFYVYENAGLFGMDDNPFERNFRKMMFMMYEHIRSRLDLMSVSHGGRGTYKVEYE